VDIFTFIYIYINNDSVLVRKLKILLMNTAQNHNPVVMILTMIHHHLIPHPEEEEEGEVKLDNQQGDKEGVGAEVV